MAMAIHHGTTTVARTFVAELPKELARYFAVSAWRVLASILVSIALAAPVGLAMGQSPKLNRIFSPLVCIAYPIPKAVLTALRLSVGAAVAVLYITKVLATQAGLGITSPFRAARCSIPRRCTRARWRWRAWG